MLRGSNLRNLAEARREGLLIPGEDRSKPQRKVKEGAAAAAFQLLGFEVDDGNSVRIVGSSSSVLVGQGMCALGLLVIDADNNKR